MKNKIQRNNFKKYINGLNDLSKSMEFEKYLRALEKYTEVIILGNGGSNSIASHISQDLVKLKNKKAFSFSDPAMLTCYINDFGMANAFVKYIEGYLSKDTFVILISSSGESKNIINCVRYLEKNNTPYGILTGFSKNNKARILSKKSCFNYHINSRNYGVVECLHQIFLHGAI